MSYKLLSVPTVQIYSLQRDCNVCGGQVAHATTVTVFLRPPHFENK